MQTITIVISCTSTMIAYIVSQPFRYPDSIAMVNHGSYLNKAHAEQLKDDLIRKDPGEYDILEYQVKGEPRSDRDKDYWYLIHARIPGRKVHKGGDWIFKDVFASFADAEEYGLTVMDEYVNLYIEAILIDGDTKGAFRIRSKCDKMP